jgi:hypothetical protein
MIKVVTGKYRRTHGRPPSHAAGPQSVGLFDRPRGDGDRPVRHVSGGPGVGQDAGALPRRGVTVTTHRAARGPWAPQRHLRHTAERTHG